MTLESVIEGIAKRCKENHAKIQKWQQEKKEREQYLERVKDRLAEATDKESIEFWNELVKDWRGSVEEADDRIDALLAGQNELFLLCEELDLDYWGIVWNNGGAQ